MMTLVFGGESKKYVLYRLEWSDEKYVYLISFIHLYYTINKQQREHRDLDTRLCIVIVFTSHYTIVLRLIYFILCHITFCIIYQ